MRGDCFDDVSLSVENDILDINCVRIDEYHQQEAEWICTHCEHDCESVDNCKKEDYNV